MTLKTRPEQLAVMGGAPALLTPCHVGQIHLPEKRRFDEITDQIWNRRWLTNLGPVHEQFESELCSQLQVRHCVLVANATLALMLVARSLNLPEGSEIIMPAFTFVATAHALRWMGYKPVFCDIENSSHNIDPSKIEALITHRTSAILGVHLWGRPCAIDHLEKIASQHNLKLFFDACHAFGCGYQGVPIGRFGSAEVFSFHATKVLNSFEGGVVATDDTVLASRIQTMRNFGFVGYDYVDGLGINAKLSEVHSAMGLLSLRDLDKNIEKNKHCYELYCTLLDEIEGIEILRYPTDGRTNYQYVVVELSDTYKNYRDKIVNWLHAENILARRYFYPGIDRLPPYSENEQTLLPVTREIASRCIVLPSGSGVDVHVVKSICAVMDLILSNIVDISNRRLEVGSFQGIRD